MNTISIYDLFMGSNCGYDFFMVWICFFNGFGYDFLMIFLWFFESSESGFQLKTREIFDFFMILLEFPFPQSLFSRKFDFGSKIVKKS